MTNEGGDGFDAAARHYNIGGYYREINRPLRRAFRGETLRVGQPGPPFCLPTVAGGNLDSSALVGESHVALVFGSYSATPLIHEIRAIDELSRCLPSGVVLAFVYTREIHPDEPVGSRGRALSRHETMAAKFARAREFQEDLDLRITVGVDDLAGTVHRAYGSLPFSQVVLDREGVVVHRSEWACADLLATVVANLHLRDERAARGPVRLSFNETLWCVSGEG